MLSVQVPRFLQKTIAFLGGGLIAGVLGAQHPGVADTLRVSGPVLRPTIVRWHGPYAGLVLAGTSVSMRHQESLTQIVRRGPMALSGLSVGYNYRFKHNATSVIAGLEADLTRGITTTDKSDSTPYWLMTARVRYGLPDGAVMPYLTAGAALSSTGNILGSQDNIQPGLVVGGGIETGGGSNIRTRLEYIHGQFLAKNPGDMRSMHMVRAALILDLK